MTERSLPTIGPRTPGVQEVAVVRVTQDPALQLRFAILVERVEEFVRAMAEGAAFPPIVLFDDGATLWLADGFHRLTAARRAQVPTIVADVRPGTWADALAFAYFANATHGEPLTPAERRAALRRIVEARPQDSTRELAGRLGVGHMTIERARQARAAVPNGTPGLLPLPPAAPPVPPADTPPTPFDTLLLAKIDERRDAVETVIAAAGDTDGAWDRAKQLAYYSRRLVPAAELMQLDPGAVVGLLDHGRRASTRAFCLTMAQWCTDVLARLDGPPVQLVANGRGPYARDTSPRGTDPGQPMAPRESDPPD